VYFICDPAREGELREAVKQGLSAIAAGSIDAESFSRAREARLKGFESNMETNAFIARNLASFRLIQEAPLSRLWERPQLYGSVTMEDIRQIAARALARGPVELVLLPENADN
jgi:predicted Zn-dependent peptidase